MNVQTMHLSGGRIGFNNRTQRNWEQPQQSSCTQPGTFWKSAIEEPLKDRRDRHYRFWA
jgi:hypothetical protein